MRAKLVRVVGMRCVVVDRLGWSFFVLVWDCEGGTGGKLYMCGGRALCPVRQPNAA